MFPRLLLSLMLLCGAAAAREKEPVAALANEWHGTWRGTLVITGPADKHSEVSLVFKIEPIKGSHDVTWAMTYGEGDKTVVKDYRLVPADEKPGRFRIDEQNGVALDACLVNGVMYSQFEVGGSVLSARYELHSDKLRFEVTSSKPAARKIPGNIKGYEVEVVQAAELRKG